MSTDSVQEFFSRYLWQVIIGLLTLGAVYGTLTNKISLLEQRLDLMTPKVGMVEVTLGDLQRDLKSLLTLSCRQNPDDTLCAARR